MADATGAQNNKVKQMFVLPIKQEMDINESLEYLEVHAATWKTTGLIMILPSKNSQVQK